MFTRAGCSPRSQLRLGLGIAFPFRGRSPLSQPLQLAFGPGDPGHTDLPWPAPSSPLAEAVPLVCLHSRGSAFATEGTGIVRFLTEENTSRHELAMAMHLFSSI